MKSNTILWKLTSLHKLYHYQIDDVTFAKCLEKEESVHKSAPPAKYSISVKDSLIIAKDQYWSTLQNMKMKVTS